MKRQEVILHDDRQRGPFVQFLTNLPLDKPIKVTIEDAKSKRTLSQLALYWMWITETAKMVSEETGHTPDEIHTYFKERFLSPHVVEIKGTIAKHYTTTKLTVAEMSNYMTQIHQFVTTELNLYVTLPEDRQAR